jgi:hypothetical protein
MSMGVTRIRYLLDQWRLRSVTVGLQHGLGKPQPPSDWNLPAVLDPRQKYPQVRREDGGKPPPS